VPLQGDGHIIGQWDRLRLDQVFTNLIGNAVKYGEGKPIDIYMRSDDGAALVSITDRGIGIAPADRERIFDRFERAVPESNYGGLGLGLWISRQIVEALGGAISLESEPGKGSTFTVRLPIKTAGEAR
jgi:two-component system OmpR family sensor kinase